MKVIALLMIIVLFGCTLTAQNNSEIFANIFKNQKAYISDSIAEKESSKYLSLITFSNIIHIKVKDEIKRINTSFWNTENMNLLEFFPNYGSVKGWIWKNNDSCYSFTFGADKKLILLELPFSQLTDTSAKKIIENYSNWNHLTFSTRGQALHSPTDHPFYLTSKIIAESIQTVGFYYQ